MMVILSLLGHRNCLTNGSWRFSFTKNESNNFDSNGFRNFFFVKKKAENPGPTRDPQMSRVIGQGDSGETSENTKKTAETCWHEVQTYPR